MNDKVILTRVYAVKRDGKKHLVRASHPGQAVAHVYGDLVSVANQTELIALLSDGAKIQEASRAEAKEGDKK